jgi:hypothetical protein
MGPLNLICLLITLTALTRGTQAYQPFLPPQIHPSPGLDNLSFLLAHLRGGWFSYLSALNQTTTMLNFKASNDLCLSASFNSTVHQLMASLADFHAGYLFRLSNYTIVLVAGLGECGFQESLEVLWDHCKRIGQCSPMRINDNI